MSMIAYLHPALTALPYINNIAVIVKSTDPSFTIKHIAVECQCANAFATSLCMGVDPHMLRYVQTQMRAQLLRGLGSGCLSYFYIPGKTHRRRREYFLHTVEVPIFCVCQLPCNKNDRAYIVCGLLVQYLLSKEWCHQMCCNIGDVVLGNPREKYLCKTCND